MGAEINSTRFKTEEWPEFARRLKAETELLRQKITADKGSIHPPVGGFEIEAWLIDTHMRPVPENAGFLKRFGSDLATPELAKFNFELNNTPYPLRGDAFAKFAREMHSTCRHANAIASEMGIRAMTTGILPTVKLSDFRMENMSQMKRYYALNRQVFKERRGKPIQLDIAGDEAHLKLQGDSVMLEAAATSFQIHTQIPFDEAHHFYNASILASAATVAATANSPFLFGKTLWHETRIPLFEQAVDTGEGFQRVSFGSGFAGESILECFEENTEAYDILLPILFEDKAEMFSHLRLHNGTIWRWNRPLVGFDADGTVHFRIEHRVMPSGPTLLDMLANAAFYYGVATLLSTECARNRFPCNFTTAQNNFYEAARHGLNASIRWEDQSISIDKLILRQLLPLAEQGLTSLGIDENDIKRYLGIIHDRVERGQNGAIWQLSFRNKYGNDMQRLGDTYWHHQQTGQPVHTWEI